MYLGLDFGTSVVKAVLTASDGSVVASGACDLQTSCPHPDWSEQNPQDWWNALKAALGQITRDKGGVRAIGLSGQMHGAVILGQDKALLRPAILWNDGRSHAEAALIEGDLPDAAMLAGVRPMPGFTAPKIRWLHGHEPDLHPKIGHILSPKDWIGWRLHGQIVTDISDAAGTLWLDQAQRRWSPELCAASATRINWLPRILPGGEIAGTLSKPAALDLGLPQDIPIIAGAGDAVAGAIAVGATRSGASYLSIGTSAQLFTVTESYRPNPGRMVHAFAHTLPDLWYQMAAMLNGAAPMRWFSGITGQPVPDLLVEAKAADPETTPLFLPYLTGERTPHGDPHIRGAFDGLTASTTRGEMMRAVVEAIAFSFADAFECCDVGQDQPPLALGGGAQSDLLLQLIADVNQTLLARASGAGTGPAVGVARLAAVAMGGLSQDDLARRPETARLFEPSPMQGDLADRLEAYRTLYQKLKPLRQTEPRQVAPSHRS